MNTPTLGLRARTARRLFVAISIVILATCRDSVGPPPPPPPTDPGTMLVELETPSANDGAVLLFIRGDGIEAVSATSAAYTVFTRESGGVLRVAVVGDLQSGPILLLEVSNVNEGFSGTVVQAADRANQQVPSPPGSSPPGYFVRIRPVNGS